MVKFEPAKEPVGMMEDMPVYKRIIVLGVVGLAVAGVHNAIVNLLVPSECTVTGNCTLNDIAEPPSDLRPGK